MRRRAANPQLHLQSCRTLQCQPEKLQEKLLLQLKEAAVDALAAKRSKLAVRSRQSDQSSRQGSQEPEHACTAADVATVHDGAYAGREGPKLAGTGGGVHDIFCSTTSYSKLEVIAHGGSAVQQTSKATDHLPSFGEPQDAVVTAPRTAVARSGHVQATAGSKRRISGSLAASLF